MFLKKKKKVDMRVKGKNFDGEGGEEEEQKLVVGYALTLKKKKSFLQPEFERLAWYIIHYSNIHFTFHVYICILYL